MRARPALLRRDARFRRLVVGNTFSTFGDSALYLTLGVWVKDLTGSNGAAGAVFLAQGTASFLAPVAGYLVDRVRRRTLLIVTNAAAALLVLTLLLVRSSDRLWLMYAVAAGYGLAFIVIGPANAALLKDLLDDDDLVAANAINATITQGLRVGSPLVGAALYAAYGGAAVAILDAVTFLAAIAALLSIQVTESRPEGDAAGGRLGPLLAGFRHLRRTAILAQLTGAAVAMLLVIGFYESVTFAVVQALGRPPAFFGVLMAVQAVGSIAAGIGTARLIRRVGEPRGLAIAMLLWAVASLVYTVARPWCVYLALVAFGMAIPLFSVAFITGLQRYTEPRMQGRVVAAGTLFTNLAQTISIAVGAALIDTIDYRILLVAVAVVAALRGVPMLLHPAPPPTRHPFVGQIRPSE